MDQIWFQRSFDCDWWWILLRNQRHELHERFRSTGHVQKDTTWRTSCSLHFGMNNFVLLTVVVVVFKSSMHKWYSLPGHCLGPGVFFNLVGSFGVYARYVTALTDWLDILSERTMITCLFNKHTKTKYKWGKGKLLICAGSEFDVVQTTRAFSKILIILSVQIYFYFISSLLWMSNNLRQRRVEADGASTKHPDVDFDDSKKVSFYKHIRWAVLFITLLYL